MTTLPWETHDLHIAVWCCLLLHSGCFFKKNSFFYHAVLLCVMMFQYMFDIKKNEEEIVIQVLQDSSVGLLETVGLQRHLIGFIVIKVRYGYASSRVQETVVYAIPDFEFVINLFIGLISTADGFVQSLTAFCYYRFCNIYCIMYCHWSPELCCLFLVYYSTESCNQIFRALYWYVINNSSQDLRFLRWCCWRFSSFLGHYVVLTGKEVGTLCRSVAFDMLVTVYKTMQYNILEDLNL